MFLSAVVSFPQGRYEISRVRVDEKYTPDLVNRFCSCQGPSSYFEVDLGRTNKGRRFYYLVYGLPDHQTKCSLANFGAWGRGVYVFLRRTKVSCTRRDLKRIQKKTNEEWIKIEKEEIDNG